MQWWDPALLSKHRYDIQGLRAVAVLLVVVNHAGVGFLGGGYVGVDVFFVLSGFLITGILLSGAAKRRYASIGDFYVRRARRILPAAALTLLLTDIVADHLLNFVRAKQVAVDSIWSSFFAANVHFAKVGTDYFARDQPPSPLQHFWSLAVEEQFYLVWPALLLVVLLGLGFLRRDRFHSQRLRISPRQVRRLLVVLVFIGAASLIWSIVETGSNPPVAYFSTFTRAWELALGAVLAITATRVVRLSPAIRTAAGWIGLAGIIVAALAFSASTEFPGYAALLPTISAALVIAAGIGDVQPRLGASRLLGLRPFRYVGDRSYSFYLWHWPVLVIAAEYAGHDPSAGTKVLLLLGAFGLSILCFALVENPIRRAKWSAPQSAMLWPVSILAVLCVGLNIQSAIETREAIAAGKAETFQPVRLQTSATPAAAPISITSPTQLAGEGPASAVLPAVVDAVRAARQGRRIPQDLSPPIGQALGDHYEVPDGCAPAGPDTHANVCRLGDTSGDRLLVVMGDSHAQMWIPAILEMAQTDHLAVVPLVKSSCLPYEWITPVSNPATGPTSATCRTWYRWALGQARALHPAAMIVSGAYGGAAPSIAGMTLDAISSLIRSMRHRARRVIVMSDTPGVNRQPVDCLLANHANLGACMTTWPYARVDVPQSLFSVASEQGAGFIDATGWFCYQLQCPSVINNTIVYRDFGHVTKTYAVELANVFRTAFRKAAEPAVR